jgi:hypothetical protein
MRFHPELMGDIMDGSVRCPHCRRACRFLGPSIAIPPKRESEAWRRLEAKIMKFRLDYAEWRKKATTRDKHDLEHRIRDLKNRPTSSGRAQLVKQLEKRLSDD